MKDDRADLRTRDDVERLVRSFYRDVAMDDRLGPIFAEARVDWPSHIERLTDFWCWQLLGEASYDGNPLRAHEPANRRTPFTGEHFERWLELFTSTVDDHFRGPTAEVAKGRASKMATALGRLLTPCPDRPSLRLWSASPMDHAPHDRRSLERGQWPDGASSLAAKQGRSVRTDSDHGSRAGRCHAG